MNPTDFWQNFSLGQEQEIACNFIYDALRNLNEMETLNEEREIFPILYNLSIGIERLLKVAIVLLEFKEDTDPIKLNNSLKTHKHIILLNKISRVKTLNLKSTDIDLLNLLSLFYDDFRYDRFDFLSSRILSKDKKAFQDFLHKHLKIDIKDRFPSVIENTIEVKQFMGTVVRNIVKEIYTVIQDSAHLKNLYTDEITSSSSKAAKVIFGDEPITFSNDETAMLEAFIFLISTKESSLVDFIRANIKPLPLDPALSSEYLQLLLTKRSNWASMVSDEVESYYEDVVDLEKRKLILNAIKDPNISNSL